MNGLTVTPEIINQLEARKVIRQEFQTLIQQYESFYHARHIGRANAMLSDINFYCQILGLKMEMVLGRTDLEGFFTETVSDLVLTRFENQIKTELETKSKPNQSYESISKPSKAIDIIPETKSETVSKVDLLQIEQVYEKTETVSIFPKAYQPKSETNSPPVPLFEKPYQKSESKSDKKACPTCKNCQKEMLDARPNKVYCNEICRIEYNNNNRKSA